MGLRITGTARRAGNEVSRHCHIKIVTYTRRTDGRIKIVPRNTRDWLVGAGGWQGAGEVVAVEEGQRPRR